MSNANQYYGGYFWVAAISFIVPLFVAYKALDTIKVTTKPEIKLDASGVDNQLWDYLLKNSVSNGLVDYRGLKTNYLFYDYIRQLGNAEPEKLATEADRLALACNAYNAFVIYGVINHKTPADVNAYAIDGVGFFNLKEHIFAGKTISLNDLEHGMIRPDFQEPRIHVALVCAARSCPAIRSEAYVGEKIEDQLEDQSRIFASSKKYVNFNEESGKLELSSILDWYGSDFDRRYPEGGYLKWLDDLIVTDGLAGKALAETKLLKSKIQEAIAGSVEKEFLAYDWKLNSQSEPGKSSGGGGAASGGSGSVLNE